MENISVSNNHRQIIKASSAATIIPDATSMDFTISIKSSAAFILHNAYLYHQSFRTAGVIQKLRNFETDGKAMTTPLVEWALTEPYEWIRTGIPHFWEKGQMAKESIGFIMMITNGSGAQIPVIVDCYALIELTTASQINMTITS